MNLHIKVLHNYSLRMLMFKSFTYLLFIFHLMQWLLIVLNHGEGVCTDPGKGDPTLGVGGPRPPGRDSEHELIGGKT